MSRPAVDAIDRLAELRQSFDRSFALAPVASGTDLAELLAVRLAGDAFAFRMAEVAALVAGRKILALPSATPEFLGVVEFRGLILPVYSLRRLLGYPAGETPRWAILTATDERVGLAFDDYEGYLQVPLTQVARPDHPEVMPLHVRDVARHADTVRAVLAVPSILESIRRRARPAGAPKER